MDDDFESVKILVEGVREDVEEVLNLLVSHFESLSPIAQIERDEERSDYVVFLKAPQASNRLRRKVSDIVNNLRHSLDQIAYASAVAVNNKVPRNAYFPMAASSSDFDDKLFGKGGRCRDIPEELRPFFRKLQPWWSSPTGQQGDDALRSLGIIAGPNKHASVIKVGLVATGLSIQRMGMCRVVYPLVWDDEAERLLIARTSDPKQMTLEYSAPLNVSLGNVRGVANIPLEHLLPLWTSKIEQILAGAEAEVKRLKA